MLAAGGPGSHKGIGSVLECLGTEEIPRLRIGIEVDGRDASGSDYVLDRFTPEEWQTVVPGLERAVEAIESVTVGIAAVYSGIKEALSGRRKFAGSSEAKDPE